MTTSVCFRLIGFLAVGMILSACATLDKSECQTADWEAIGYEDGTRGYTATRIGKHRSACAKHGVTPDLALYTKGRERGLLQYCRTSVGYRTGLSGKGYKNVCPPGSEKEFLMGYRYGRGIYKISREIRSLQSQVRREEKLIDETGAIIQETEAELIRTGVSRARRAFLLNELKALSAKKQDHEIAIADLYERIDRANAHLDELQAKNPYAR